MPSALCPLCPACDAHVGSTPRELPACPLCVGPFAYAHTQGEGMDDWRIDALDMHMSRVHGVDFTRMTVAAYYREQQLGIRVYELWGRWPHVSIDAHWWTGTYCAFVTNGFKTPTPTPKDSGY